MSEQQSEAYKNWIHTREAFDLICYDVCLPHLRQLSESQDEVVYVVVKNHLFGCEIPGCNAERVAILFPNKRP